MARPREFDRQVALDRAMNFFWRNGYKSSSMSELLGTMGIGRQSLYDTFGGKHELFIEALELYYDHVTRTMIARLEESGKGIDSINSYFDWLCREFEQHPARSCLMVNTANELAADDPEAAAIVNRFINRLQRAFAKVLATAEAKGEIGTENMERRAWFLTSVVIGFGPLGKAGMSPEVMCSIVEEALDSIRR